MVCVVCGEGLMSSMGCKGGGEGVWREVVVGLLGVVVLEPPWTCFARSAAVLRTTLWNRYVQFINVYISKD